MEKIFLFLAVVSFILAGCRNEPDPVLITEVPEEFRGMWYSDHLFANSLGESPDKGVMCPIPFINPDTGERIINFVPICTVTENQLILYYLPLNNTYYSPIDESTFLSYEPFEFIPVYDLKAGDFIKVSFADPDSGNTIDIEQLHGSYFIRMFDKFDRRAYGIGKNNK